MPDVADGIPVRWIDVASPWLAEAGGDARGDRLEAAIVARVKLRYDETKADLVHDQEYECVITPLGETVDVSQATVVVVWAAARVMLMELFRGRLMRASATPQYLMNAMLLPTRTVACVM